MRDTNVTLPTSLVLVRKHENKWPGDIYMRHSGLRLHITSLMMRNKMVPEKSVSFIYLTWLTAWVVLIESCHHESFRSYDSIAYSGIKNLTSNFPILGSEYRESVKTLCISKNCINPFVIITPHMWPDIWTQSVKVKVPFYASSCITVSTFLKFYVLYYIFRCKRDFTGILLK